MPSPASPSIAAIRTLALVGPAAAGKTSLAECLLHRAGMIGAVGSLERGTTVSDHDPLERRMQHSLNASILHLDHAGTRVHLIDTPGSPDFVGQSLPALEAVETAVIVINAAIAANGFRFRVPYGTLLCVSDKPLHGEIKLPGMANQFYRERVDQHLRIGMRAVELLRRLRLDQLHSRKLRSFAEVAFQ